MSRPKKIIAHIGHVYRVVRKGNGSPACYTIEALHDDEWEPALVNTTADFIAKQLVKHGVAEDNAAAYHLIESD